MDEALGPYGERLLRTGLGPVIQEVSSQGSIADMASLTPGGTPGWFRAGANKPGFSDQLALEVDRARSAADAVGLVQASLAPYADYYPEDLHTAHLDALFNLAASRAVSQVTGHVRRGQEG
jgi:hypothetical protein